MKNFFKSIAKAFVYFAVYFMAQILVMVGYAAVLTVQFMAEAGGAPNPTDTVELVTMMTVALMDKLLDITFWSGVFILFIYWIRFAVRKKNFLKEVEIKKIPKNTILPIVVTGLGLNVIVSVVISSIPWPQEWMDAYATNSSVIDGSLISVLTAIVMAPVLEEIVFRGLIYTRLKKGMPAIVAASIASIIFGLCHGTAIWIIYTTFLGLVMNWVFVKHGSLTASILFHFSFNLMGIILSLIPESMSFVVWILLVAGVVGVAYGVKQMMEFAPITEEVVELIDETEEIAEEICE